MNVNIETRPCILLLMNTARRYVMLSNRSSILIYRKCVCILKHNKRHYSNYCIPLLSLVRGELFAGASDGS